MDKQNPTLLANLWQHKWVIAAAAVMAAVVAYGLSFLLPTSYTAEGSMLLRDPQTMASFAQQVGFSPDPKRHLLEQAELLESPAVAQSAVDILGTDMDWRDLQKKMVINPSFNKNVISIVGIQPTAAGSVDLVNALVQAYEQSVIVDVQSKASKATAELEQSKASLQTELDGITAELKSSETMPGITPAASGTADLEDQQGALLARLLEAASPALDRMGTNADLAHQQNTLLTLISGIDTRVRSLQIDTSLYGSGVSAYLEPEPPEYPTQPRPLRNAAVAGILGLISTAAWVWWRGSSDRLEKDPAEAA